jgi:transposase-like protein
VRLHVEGRESYRVIARRVCERTGRKISPTSLQRMVARVGARSKSAWEMSYELRPRWDEYLLVDEKMCSVRGQQQWFYLAADRTGDIAHCRAVKDLTFGEAVGFLEEVKALSKRLGRGGIVTDLDTVLTKAVELVYAGKPHQYCLKHALAALEKLLGYKPVALRWRLNRRLLGGSFKRLRDRKGVWVQRAREEFLESWQATRELSERYRLLKALRDDCHSILFARTETQAEDQLKRLRRSRSYRRKEKKQAVAFLERHWDHLMMHHRVLGLPRTTNIIENVNKQLERRLKTIESFQHRSTASNYMNLLVAYLRQKPYTDCRGARKQLNGKSRLQAAGVCHPADWLTLALKSSKIGNR